MKSLKDYILETSEDKLNEKICANIKDELLGAGVEVYYVEPGDDKEEEYPQVYVATCNYESLKLWNDIAKTTELVNIVENCGVEYLRVNTNNLMYNGKKAFEIIFTDLV